MKLTKSALLNSIKNMEHKYLYIVINDDDDPNGVGVVKDGDLFICGTIYWEGYPDSWCFDTCDVSVAKTPEEAADALFNSIYDLSLGDSELPEEVQREVDAVHKAAPTNDHSEWYNFIKNEVVPLVKKFWDEDKIPIEVEVQ